MCEVRVIGIQRGGTSDSAAKKMAMAAKRRAVSQHRIATAADIGGGRGDLTRELARCSDSVLLLDYDPAESIGKNVKPVQVDLNQPWPIDDGAVNFSFSLECIEHIENPRHFMREMTRITTSGGHIFITTPNNESLSSKITFCLRGMHRYFQEASYPAHISPILHVDFLRMADECGLRFMGWFYSGYDTVPRLRWKLPFGGKWCSDTVGVLLQKL